MLALFALCFSSFVALAASAPTPHYHFIREIAIGGQGGWDYVSADPEAHRLYLAQATRVVVVDTDSGKILGDVADTPGVHGFATAPELGRGFSSNGKEGTVSIVELSTLKTLAKVQAGENPDAIVYDPATREVYAFNGRSHSATVIGAESGKVVATIPLPGKPESVAMDPAANRIYTNLEDKSEVVAIDSKDHRIAAHWPVAPCETPVGLAIDAERHRLFIACENRKMVMLDASTGKVLSDVPTGGRVDAAAFDPGLKLAFSSNGEGNVTIAHEASPERLEVAQTLETERGARTMALDPRTHRIYLPTARFEPAPSDQRPKIVPGTLKILVYGP